MARLSDELVQRLLAGFTFEDGVLELFSESGAVVWSLPVTLDSLAVSGRAVQKAGIWTAKATGHGRVERYRLSEDGASMDGTVTESDGGGDMEIDDQNMTPGKLVTVTSFSVAL